MCTFMGLLPPRFSIDTAQLSDSEAARRFTVKPQTVVDAAYLGQRDILMGLMAGVFGYVHDVGAGAGRFRYGLGQGCGWEGRSLRHMAAAAPGV